MDWEELLLRFRELGGTVENVRLGRGPFGRGAFIIDGSRPVTLRSPENVMFAVHELEIRDGQLCLKTGAAAGEPERRFFEDYQRHFGWGAGLFEEIRTLQEEWHRLPGPIVDFMRSMGTLEDPHRRFLPATDDSCLHHFVNARDFYYGGVARLVPLLDIPNHCGTAAAFEIGSSGIAIQGTFEDEIFVRYNLADAWANALTYGFSDLSLVAYSVGIVVDLHGGLRLSAKRGIRDGDVRDGVRFPHAQLVGDVLNVSHLMLGNLAAPDIPRAVFRKLVSPMLDVIQADLAFDGIAHFNRKKFLDLLRLLASYDGEIVTMLRAAAINQLEALSASVGARALQDA